MNVDRKLGAESRRQREGSGNVGAFGRRTGHSDLLFFEGILPESDGSLLSDGSTDEQIRAAFETLESRLADRRNKTIDDVLKLEVHLTDPADAERFDQIYNNRFGSTELPPRTVIGVCSLPGGADIQLDVIAADE